MWLFQWERRLVAVYFWKIALTNLLSGLDNQQRKEQHKGILEEGKKSEYTTPITLFFSFCQCMDWRNGAQQRICSSPPCKTQEMLPLNSPPHFLHFCPLPAGSVASPGPPESSAQQLHTWRSPSSVLPENSICSRHLE